MSPTPRLPKPPPLTIGEVTVEAGKRARFDLKVARLPTGTWASLPIKVIRGRKDGPTVWLSGAIHGDEINGVEIIRRVLPHLDPRRLKGTVIAVPIVNVFGFIEGSRYLPDGRDLNRSFPGSARGSLASRLAHLFLTEIIDHCDLGLDLHTAAGHRINHPQIRADLDDPETLRLATAFGAPLMFGAKLRDGSLRQATIERGKKVLLYEAGQTHRFDQDAVTIGVTGVLRTLEAMGLDEFPDLPPPRESAHLQQTSWIRARRGGVVNLEIALGQQVEKGQALGTIADAFGERPSIVRAPWAGWVIAFTQHPLVSQGDALVHLGTDSPAVGTSRPARSASSSRSRRGPDLDTRRNT
ncbi:MAG: putative deacylase [Glaciecola sp.]|jgi:predicted deacylase